MGQQDFTIIKTSLILAFKAVEVQGRKLSRLEAMLKDPPWFMAVKPRQTSQESLVSCDKHLIDFAIMWIHKEKSTD